MSDFGWARAVGVGSPDDGGHRNLTLADVPGERPLLLGSCLRRADESRPAAATGERRIPPSANWDFRPSADVYDPVTSDRPKGGPLEASAQLLLQS